MYVTYCKHKHTQHFVNTNIRNILQTQTHIACIHIHTGGLVLPPAHILLTAFRDHKAHVSRHTNIGKTLIENKGLNSGIVRKWLGQSGHQQHDCTNKACMSTRTNIHNTHLQKYT